MVLTHYKNGNVNILFGHNLAQDVESQAIFDVGLLSSAIF